MQKYSRFDCSGSILPGEKRPLISRQKDLIANRYELQSCIGTGLYRTVYKARDVVDDSPVALKLMRYGFSHAEEGLFAQELQALALLHHPHLVVAKAFGHDAKRRPYLVTELLQGATPITLSAWRQPL